MAEQIFKATMDAVSIMEIANIKAKYYSTGMRNWAEKEIFLEDFNKLHEHSSDRIVEELLNFLVSVSHTTRGGMPSYLSSSIFSLVLHFYPAPNSKKTVEHGELCIQIGHSFVYDAARINRHTIFLAPTRPEFKEIKWNMHTYGRYSFRNLLNFKCIAKTIQRVCNP